MVDISIIIPYYNAELYIHEGIDSILAYSGKYEYEIIIINDGSTDHHSLQILKSIEDTGLYKVLHQENKGPASARNTGCKAASGSYFLFLDSDNKITPQYIDIALDLLMNDAELGIVYADAFFFGDGSRPGFITNGFNIQKLLASNYIDMCSFIRKTAWQSVGGMDESKDIFTHEDWDFWLSLYEKGWKFKFINQKLFHYRIRRGSLIDTHIKNNEAKSRELYIANKHAELYRENYTDLYVKSDININTQVFWSEKQEQEDTPLRYSEARSTKAWYSSEGKTQRLRLYFPDDLKPVTRLRLDIANRPLAITLHGMYLLNAEEDVLWQWSGDQDSFTDIVGVAFFREQNAEPHTLFTLNNDPRFDIALPDDILASIQPGCALVLDITPCSLASQLPYLLAQIEKPSSLNDKNCLIAAQAEQIQNLQEKQQQMHEQLLRAEAQLDLLKEVVLGNGYVEPL
ncbi:glycosyltransferase family 2 protein [Azomonas macrocytogenes]|uniref:Glycosyltransferase involved in cell wall biosynthesis n=1 Tax=Azomonas macrocytogenes TaxID=69962 RepID=A0A839T235_AZOMA|nr:glycosyltransferase family A protein [Azomonas macrocytogenes]MBB3102454.1 glycosyltransferase involved in cell wall biosynthesis [Azomonas macrocytogenes]